MTKAKNEKALASGERPRTASCRLCGARMRFTQGLDEMADHWEMHHPEALERLRSKLGHDQER